MNNTYLDSLADMKDYKIISTIDWVTNSHTTDSQFFEHLHKQSADIESIDKQANQIIFKIDSLLRWKVRILDNTILIHDLEKLLQENFSTEAAYVDDNWFIRFANCFAWADTQIHREASKIDLPDWETRMPTKTNMWGGIIDPIGWASKWLAPSWGYNNWSPKWYGLLWKILQLRPMAKEFNQEIYEEIMNTRVLFEDMWISFESSEEEVAIMPTIKIHWGEDLISQFSEGRETTDIQTAKHYWINL